MTRAAGVLASVRRSAVVFVFHDVSDSAWFEDCVREISSTREILSLEEVVSRRQARTCALTFDDGRISVAEVVHPVLRSRGMPCTVFLCTDVLTGGPVPWFIRVEHLVDFLGLELLRSEWDLAPEVARTKIELVTALKEIPIDVILAGVDRIEEREGIEPPAPGKLFLQRGDVKQLAAEGVSFQAHSHRHPILTKLGIEDQKTEIDLSRDEIQSITGIRPSHFAYPNGTSMDFDAVTVSALRTSGFTHAYTTVQRHLSPSDDPFALPRIGISSGESPTHQALKQLAPWLSRSQASESRIRNRVRELGREGNA
jgi:peptidoglycan/xylan/chitin deacetylase (PgdA/CDA1 family)